MVLYDCEIVKAIPSKYKKTIDDIEYCDGWTDFEGMGISVIAAYDYGQDIYHTFCKDNLAEFQKLIDGRDVAGFNSNKFDDKLCMAHGVEIVSKDIMLFVMKVLGAKSFKGLSLGACCKANGVSSGKTGDGAMAPVDWQRGNYGKVIDYCINDVWMLKQLYDTINKNDYIYDPRRFGRRVEI